MLGAIYAGIIYFVVNVIAIGVFNVTDATTLIVINILPTFFAIVLILRAVGKI